MIEESAILFGLHHRSTRNPTTTTCTAWTSWREQRAQYIANAATTMLLNLAFGPIPSNNQTSQKPELDSYTPIHKYSNR